MNRRRFALAAMSSATLLVGCESSEPKPALDATLLHNKNIRNAVSELDQGINALDMHLGLFNAENWQDALSNLQTSVVRMRGDVDELKRALGYAEGA